MMLRTLGVVAALLLTTSLAQAAFNADDVVAQLTSDGYTKIEVKIGQKVAKVEAIKGTTKIEVTYDIASGDVLKSETDSVDPNDDTTPGVEIQDQGGQGDDDGPNHDVNDDNGGGNDDGANPGHDGTAPGQDDVPNHDVNDDNGGGNDDGANPGHDGAAPGQDDDHGGSGHDGDDDGGSDDNGNSGGNDD